MSNIIKQALESAQHELEQLDNKKESTILAIEKINQAEAFFDSVCNGQYLDDPCPLTASECEALANGVTSCQSSILTSA